jgi:hypothetical protein
MRRMRLGFPVFQRLAAGLILAGLHAPPALAETMGAAPPPLPVILGVVVFVLLIAFGLGRHAFALRRDFLRLLSATPERGAALFRDAPAGLPDGSVRAAIAVAIVLVTLPALVLSRALGLGSTGELGTILGGVLGYYFGARGGADPAAAMGAAMGAARIAEHAAVTRNAEDRAVQAHQVAEAANRLPALADRAADAAAAARAIAALLPAGPAGALHRAGDTVDAVSRALRDPSPTHIAAAVEAAGLALREAGEGSELAARLNDALRALGAAAGTLGAMQSAVRDPSPDRLAEAATQAARLAGAPEGLAAAIAPALGLLGTTMRLPGVAGALGLAGPAGVATALLVGAAEAARIGRAHYQRWVARVLDRPVSRDLFPAGEWDGEAARALIGADPALATALAPRIGPDAPQAEAAAALADLLEHGAGARLFAAAPDAFASQMEAEAAIARLRRLLLEREIDAADPRPITLGELAVPQPRLRQDLDLLREAGAGEALDTLLLLADGVIAARPDAAAPTLAAAVAAAAAPRMEDAA